MLWVNRDTAVGRGSGPQSDEARFLTGQFIRAGDFDQWETGGPSSAETGLFCPNTPLCNCSQEVALSGSARQVQELPAFACGERTGSA